MPYRAATLRPSAASARRRWRAPLFGLVVASLILAAVFAERTRRRRAWERGAGARAAGVANAGRLASGAQVSILHGEGDAAVIVRLPGRPVRRGGDIVWEAELTPAPGAVALMPDGVWAVDARGRLFDTRRARSAPAQGPRDLPYAAGHGRAVQVAVGRWALAARLADGAVAMWDDLTPEWRAVGGWQGALDLSVTDLYACALLGDGRADCRTFGSGEAPGTRTTTDALRVPRPRRIVGGFDEPLCARGALGDVACVWARVEYSTSSSGSLDLQPASLAGASRASAIAVGGRDLCVVDFEGGLSCAVGPGDDRTGLIVRPRPIALHREGEGAAEVALSNGVGCVRQRTGEVLCWGQVFRDRGVVRRDVPVTIEGLDAVSSLVDHWGLICALQRGEVYCWGGRSDWDIDEEVALPRPRAIPAGGVVTALTTASTGRMCVLVDGRTVRCWEGDPFTTAPQDVATFTSTSLRSLVGGGWRLYALDEHSRAWRIDPLSYATTVVAPIPPFDGFERLAVDESVVCARRGPNLRCIGESVSTEPWEEIPARERDQLLASLQRTTPPSDSPRQSFTRRVFDPGDAGIDPPRTVLGAGVVATFPGLTGPHSCLLGENGRVACQQCYDRGTYPDPRRAPYPYYDAEEATLVPGIEDAVEVATNTRRLACVRRRSGRVACWGQNAGGALTVAESAGAPRLLRLEEIIARATRGRGTTSP